NRTARFELGSSTWIGRHFRTRNARAASSISKPTKVAVRARSSAAPSTRTEPAVRSRRSFELAVRSYVIGRRRGLFLGGSTPPPRACFATPPPGRLGRKASLAGSLRSRVRGVGVCESTASARQAHTAYRPRGGSSDESAWGSGSRSEAAGGGVEPPWK